MFRSSLDAIRKFLSDTFPNVDKIYLYTVPPGFKRPSFFVELVSGFDDDLCKALYLQQATWQIIYFAPVDSDHNPDVFNQLQTADTLREKLKEGLTLTAPDGTVFDIIDCECSPRDGEVYMTIRLEVDRKRPEPVFDLMQDIQHKQKEG